MAPVSSQHTNDDDGTTFQTTRGTVTLEVNDENVFEFEVNETTEYGPIEPLFRDNVGEIERFIEGPWVTEIADFVNNVKAHEDHAWKVRNAPGKAKEAEDLKKRFGL